MKNPFEKDLKIGTKTVLTINGVKWTVERNKFNIIRCVSEKGEVINTVDIYSGGFIESNDTEESLLAKLVEYIRFKSN